MNNYQATLRVLYALCLVMGTGYVVFILGNSPWWFLALIVFMPGTIQKKR